MDRKPLLSYVLQKMVLQPLLVLGIIVAGFYLVEDHTLRVDLTEDDRFSISEYSHELAASLKNPLTIRTYFSDNIPPRIVPLQRQVFDVLSEYVAHGKGKVRLESRNPLESKALEDEAKNYGVQPVKLLTREGATTSAIDAYGGIVLLYADKESQVINIAERYTQGYEGLSALEYEISSRIWQLTNDKPRIGLTGYLEKEAGGNPFAGGGGRPQPEFTELRRFLGQEFEVETVDLKEAEPDPAKMPLLVVVRPKDFSDVETYRLDQYLVKGGRVLMFITQGTIEQSPFGEPGWSIRGFKTGLDEWLEHHGLRVPNEVVCHGITADRAVVEQIVEVNGRRFRRPVEVPNWFWPVLSAEVDEDALNRSNPAIRTLPGIVLLWPHPVDVLDDRLDGKTAEVLVRSHADESWRWKDMNRVDMRVIDFQADRPSAGSIRASPMAVAVEGTFTSLYAEKRPVPPSLAGGGEKEEAGCGCGDEGCGADGCGDGCGAEGCGCGAEEPAEAKEPAAPPVVKKGTVPTHLVVIGNAVFISDPALKQRSDDHARQIGLLAFNLADWLARSPELIALRAKTYSNRMLVDEEFKDYLAEQAKLRQEGEIDDATYEDRMARAKEKQNARWKSIRWINVLVPTAIALIAGFAVLILRWGLRGSGRAPAHLAKLPPREPPPAPEPARATEPPAAPSEE